MLTLRLAIVISGTCGPLQERTAYVWFVLSSNELERQASSKELNVLQVRQVTGTGDVDSLTGTK